MTTELLRNWTTIAAGFLLGATLAILHLVSLWISVQRVSHTARPGSWLLVTSAFRIVTIAAAFAWIVAGSWQRLAGCLAGFVIVRWVAVNRISSQTEDPRKGQHRAN